MDLVPRLQLFNILPQGFLQVPLESESSLYCLIYQRLVLYLSNGYIWFALTGHTDEARAG